jgi:hypothetical protein
MSGTASTASREGSSAGGVVQSPAAAAATSLETASLVVFLCAWAFFIRAGPRLLGDPGTFWHTLVGERILVQGFPRSDWLTFTAAGQPWIAHQWLAECGMAALHRIGGIDALLVATGAALAALFAWLLARLAAAGIVMRYAAVCVSLVLLASARHLHVRPHLFSIFAFAWMYARLADVERGARSIGSLWPLSLVFLVWVNTHGAAVGGLGTLMLVTGGWTLGWLVRRASPVRSGRDAAALGAIVLASFATVPLTPYGLDTARAWGSILASPALPRMIREHASLIRTYGWQVLPLAALYAAALRGTPLRAWSVTSVVPIVWLALAFERVRHAPFFAVAAAIALEALLPRARWVGALARRGLDVRGHAGRRPRPRVALASAVALLVALAGVAFLHRGGTLDRPTLVRLEPSRWPVALVPALRAAQRSDRPDGVPVLNDMLFGGFVEYYAPGLRPFVDDRWELFGDDFMLSYVRADRSWLDAWVRRADVSLALAANGSSLQRYLESSGDQWRRVASSAPATLYRRDPAPARP